jgi:hypothetical protein
MNEQQTHYQEGREGKVQGKGAGNLRTLDDKSNAELC